MVMLDSLNTSDTHSLINSCSTISYDAGSWRPGTSVVPTPELQQVPLRHVCVDTRELGCFRMLTHALVIF